VLLERMLTLVDSIPLKEDVCVECQLASWRSVGLFVEPTKH
jgi:hypothetical protein